MKSKLMQMILHRIGHSLIVLVLVTLLVFLVMQAVPGDPIKIFLGPTATQEQIDHYTKLFGYDKPVLVQYGRWVVNLFHGQMGRSVLMQREVSEFIFEKMAITLTVVLPAALFCRLSLEQPWGSSRALNRGKAVDSFVSTLANIGMATPLFWMGILLILLLTIKLGILPVQGYVPPWVNLGKSVQRLIMPVIICSLTPTAVFTRQTRSAMLEVIRQDYVRTARAKGVSRKDIILKHQLRNALIPIITVMGLQLGMMVGTTIIIESLFVIPGLGSTMITAIRSKDFMVVQNVVLVISVFIIFCNLVVDLLYGVIDPRIRDRR